MKKRITKLLKTNKFHTTVLGLVRFDIVILFSEVQCFSKPGQQLICPCLFTCSIIRCVVYVTMQISSRNLPYQQNGRIKRHTDGIISDCAKKMCYRYSYWSILEECQDFTQCEYSFQSEH